MLKKTSLRGLMAVLLLVTTSLACSLFERAITPTPNPTYTPLPPTSIEPTQPIEQQIETAISVTTTPGVMQIKLTDAQMTQFLTDQLKTQTDPILENPSVHAHDNVVDVTGQIKRGIISGEVTIKLVPAVDTEGKPHLQIQSANFGSIPVPKAIVDNLSSLVDDAMGTNADPGQTGYTVTSIEVFDGYIVINAKPQ
jgi:hypothetical protein